MRLDIRVDGRAQARDDLTRETNRGALFLGDDRVRAQDLVDPRRFQRRRVIVTLHVVTVHFDELRVLLARAGEPSPYLLVGHSYGGLVMRIFASRAMVNISSKRRSRVNFIASGLGVVETVITSAMPRP